MPILERTPPVRRAPVGADNGLETSSPSRAKLDRNGGEKQVNAAANEGEYVFPPLDAMASAVREKNLGMSMNGRYTPTLSRGGENQGASGGLRGSASGGSGRRMLGAGGRNAPVLTATAAKVHPPLGSTSESKKINTSRPSASSKNEGTPQENPQQQQQQPVRSHDYDERPIRGGAIVSIDQATSSGSTDSRAFEAQMERALASGANPFQDRKRDQMRGDSSIVVASRDSPQQQVKSPRLHSPRPMTRRMDESTPQTEMSIPLVRSPAPARKPLPSDVYNKQSTPTKARLSRPHTPDSERKRGKQTLIRLQEDVAAKTLQVEKAQAEAEDAKRSLTEREKLNRQQNDRIKGLEREVKQLQVVKRSASDEDNSMAKLMVISTSWEVSRISFMTGLSKAQALRERDVEAVIYRNEVTYMDARRAEAQLELEDERIRGKELVAVVKEMKREEGRLQARVQVLQDSKEESERRNAGVQESQDELLAEIETGKKERAAVEKELRLMKMKYEEEREKRAKAKDELLVIEKQLTKERSSQRRNLDESDEMRTPVQLQRKQKQKVIHDTKKQHVQKETIEPIRQSPRKAAISAAFKSTISSVRGSSGSKQVAREEEEEEQQGMDTFDDIDVAPLAASKGAKKVVEAKKTTARQKTPTEEMDDFDVDDDSGDDDDLKTAKKPKKKSSILSRGKKPVVKEVGGAKGAKGKKAIDDDAEMQRQVEQTPMIVNKKKRKPSVEDAEEEEQEEEGEPENSMKIDATPVVKLKAKTRKKGGGKPMQELDEDRSLLGTRTPMVQTKRSALGAGLPQQGSIQNGNAASSSASVTMKRATTTTTEVKKKKRRLLKPNTNVANNFFSANGDEEGDLDPKLNLPLQLSPVKGGGGGGEGIMTSSSSTLLGGKKGMSAAASRVFRR